MQKGWWNPSGLPGRSLGLRGHRCALPCVGASTALGRQRGVATQRCERRQRRGNESVKAGLTELLYCGSLFYERSYCKDTTDWIDEEEMKPLRD